MIKVFSKIFMCDVIAFFKNIISFIRKLNQIKWFVGKI